jgi:hypothetical protein
MVFSNEALMPDKPLWIDRIPQAIAAFESLPDGWVDRPLLESLLGVGRRRAQQILAPVASRRVGASVMARREDVAEHLKRLASGQAAYYESRRKRRLWAELGRAREQWVEQPPVLVEVAETERRRIETLDFERLPEGVELRPGSILLRFSQPDEALRKLMALAMAISHNRDAFDRQVALREG